MTPTLSELRSVMEQISFPSDATDFFCRLWERIDEREELRATLLTAEKQYWEAADTATARQTLTDALEASPYSVDLLLLLVCAPRLRAVYAEKGYPDALCVDALRDLTYKLSECLDVYGVYGTAAFSWHEGFYRLRRFALGRLQYDVGPFTSIDVPALLGEELPALRVHIPSSGPLSDELVEDSLRRAYLFLGVKGRLAFFCSSWMLYPPHYTVFPEGSNLRRFYDRFTILSQKETDLHANLWRVFHTTETNISRLTATNSLQRNLLSYLQAGNRMGTGLGVILYDPEKQ